jgi:signal transduction histidine kinase
MTLRAYTRTFSFRAGVAAFGAFCVVLLILRVMLYFQAVRVARDDTEAIIRAYESQIRVTVEQSSEPVTEEYIRSLIEEAHDRHFVVAMHEDEPLPARASQAVLAILKDGVVVGNIQAWPPEAHGKGRWVEFQAPYYGSRHPAHILASVTHYPQGFSLLVGYDMVKLDALKRSLWIALIENVAFAFVAAFLLSVMLIFLLNRHMRGLNQAFSRVRGGGLDYRLPVGTPLDEFDRLARNFNRTMDWVETLLETVRNSGNALAHDMRTPLSQLRLDMQVLAEQPCMDHSARQLAARQTERIDSIITMFDNILTIARAEARTGVELFETVDVQKLVENVLEFYAPMIEEKHLRLDVHLTPASLRADRQLLSQAVMNLIDNACKYSPEGAPLAVRLEADSEAVRLHVADRGPGIPEELRAKVQQRFFRVDASRHTPGHGLGLSLVRAVAELHQGALILEDHAPGLRAILTLRSAHV